MLTFSGGGWPRLRAEMAVQSIKLVDTQSQPTEATERLPAGIDPEQLSSDPETRRAQIARQAKANREAARRETPSYFMRYFSRSEGAWVPFRTPRGEKAVPSFDELACPWEDAVIGSDVVEVQAFQVDWKAPDDQNETIIATRRPPEVEQHEPKRGEAAASDRETILALNQRIEAMERANARQPMSAAGQPAEPFGPSGGGYQLRHGNPMIEMLESLKLMREAGLIPPVAPQVAPPAVVDPMAAAIGLLRQMKELNGLLAPPPPVAVVTPSEEEEAIRQLKRRRVELQLQQAEFEINALTRAQRHAIENEELDRATARQAALNPPKPDDDKDDDKDEDDSMVSKLVDIASDVVYAKFGVPRSSGGDSDVAPADVQAVAAGMANPQVLGAALMANTANILPAIRQVLEQVGPEGTEQILAQIRPNK